jgi:hypothetical protein
MRSSQTAMNPLFRSLAILTLAVFVAAEVMCFVHCHFGGGHGNAAEASCHGATSSEPGHDEDGPIPSATASCFTLQNLLTTSGALTLVVPEFPSLYTVAPVALALDTTATELTASVSRPAWPRNWVFTPEVYLGPALHSLAPPLLS